MKYAPARELFRGQVFEMNVGEDSVLSVCLGWLSSEVKRQGRAGVGSFGYLPGLGLQSMTTRS